MPLARIIDLDQLLSAEHRAGVRSRPDHATAAPLQGTVASDPDIAEYIRWLGHTGGGELVVKDVRARVG